MKKKDDIIEIPFGAKDSELYKFEYTIPEGYEAEIKDGKVVVQKKESEDERIRKEIISAILSGRVYDTDLVGAKHIFELDKEVADAWIAYLEKQKEQIQTEVERKYIKTIKCLIDDFLRSNKRDVDRWYYQNICDWLDGRHIEQMPAEWSDSVAKDMFIKALERAVEQTKKGYELTDCDKNSWWEDFKAYSGIRPAEWSEEDEKMIKDIIDYILPMPIFFETTTGESGKEFTREFIEKATNWLKSLRPQPHWKPSDEQINALSSCVTLGELSYEGQEDILIKLLNNLKKL